MFAGLKSYLDSVEKRLMEQSNLRRWKYFLGVCVIALIFLSTAQGTLNNMLREMHQGIPYGLEDLQFSKHNPQEIMRAWREHKPRERLIYTQKLQKQILRMFSLPKQVPAPIPEVLSIIFWRTLIIQLLTSLLWVPILYLLLIKLRTEIRKKIDTLPGTSYKTFPERFIWISGIALRALPALLLLGPAKTLFTSLHFQNLSREIPTSALADPGVLGKFLQYLSSGESIIFWAVLVVLVFAAILLYLNGDNLLRLGRTLLLLKIQFSIITIIGLVCKFFAGEP